MNDIRAMPPQPNAGPADPYAAFGMPEAGLENYWYPVLPARRVGRRPRAVTVLGHRIVLFREGANIHALADRCPHRGASLALGKSRFAGTISCPYHGWTFRGTDGACVAAIMEGPDSKLPGTVHVTAYPARVARGLVWLFMGGPRATPDSVAFAEDVPELINDAEFFTITAVTDYACNWRVLTDNWTNEQHGPYVHGNSPELLLQPLPPFNLTLSVIDHGNGRSIGVRGTGGMTHAEFPGLGRFPASNWHRVMKPTGRGVRGNWEKTRAAREFGVKTPTATRLPGLVIVARPSGDYFLIQWALPIDATHTRLFNINCFRRRGALRAAYDRLHYLVWRGWAHDRVFSDQDKRVVESVITGPERLSRSDIGLVGWRRFVAANARGRKPPAETAP